jgi:hypothetical protein
MDCGCDHDCRDYTCRLCGDVAHAMSGILDHMRLMHPAVQAEPGHWPDGRYVIFEDVA